MKSEQSGRLVFSGTYCPDNSKFLRTDINQVLWNASHRSHLAYEVLKLTTSLMQFELHILVLRHFQRQLLYIPIPSAIVYRKKLIIKTCSLTYLHLCSRTNYSVLLPLNLYYGFKRLKSAIGILKGFQSGIPLSPGTNRKLKCQHWLRQNFTRL